MTGSMSRVLTFQDLQRITGYQRRSDVERSLIEQGVHIFRGRCGPWTTLDLINRAGGLDMQPANDKYAPDIL